ncbi:ABC transporter ATP-binding protein [Thermincola potens]|uniref:ABC transporter related protein n=1 Tax=Thermincola potens (strain JR) TaxID=635013 RepID=D5XB65_THEPJ|nr:ABC transporter ATP-binding protein [Thermincola potens]ADG81385.1 ABC transporter related protein [Thermincola potens JR]
MAVNHLEIKNVTKAYVNRQQQIVALDKVSFEIDEGELFCILGPSGCGKSTLLRCIAGFEQVTEGEILVGGRPVDKPGPDRTMVFQGFDQLLPWKTVLENVEYPLKVNKLGSPTERRERAAEFLELVGLSEFKDNYPHQLSGGMKQRVAIARALALKPKVLLMDEPFASLDAQTRTVLQTELIGIWEKFRPTIIFITHNIQEAIILGSKIAVMSKRPGTIKKIITNQLGRPRFVGYPGFDEMWQELHALLDYNRIMPSA